LSTGATRRPAGEKAYNAGMKECPMCGETMRLSIRETQDAVPGGGHTAVRVTREWVCPECDYFEEAEPGEDQAT
jgi:YgiT-type zinc finger domain-containing protein